VIAIIAILAAMLLPVLAHVKLVAYKKQTQIQVNDIATAIQAYDSAYGRFPISPAAQAAASTAGSDITYCGTYTNAAGFWPPSTSPGPGVASTCVYANGNADVISTLMDFTNYPDSFYGGSTINTNYQKNPQKTQFLNAKMSSWDPHMAGAGTPSPRVGNDLVYRDIWGNPFIISMDANYDGQCQDAFYGLSKVSNQTANSPQGFNGLINPVDPTGANDNYRFHGTVMVWSMGPYGPATPAASSFDPTMPANAPANKSHIASWQ